MLVIIINILGVGMGGRIFFARAVTLRQASRKSSKNANFSINLEISTKIQSSEIVSKIQKIIDSKH